MVWNVPKAAGSCLTTSNWPKYLHLNPPARRYCYFCDLQRMQMTLFGVSGSHWSPASCSRRQFCLSLGWFRLRCRAGQGGGNRKWPNNATQRPETASSAYVASSREAKTIWFYPWSFLALWTLSGVSLGLFRSRSRITWLAGDLSHCLIDI